MDWLMPANLPHNESDEIASRTKQDFGRECDECRGSEPARGDHRDNLISPLGCLIRPIKFRGELRITRNLKNNAFTAFAYRFAEANGSS
jgi:hypothetical protein